MKLVFCNIYSFINQSKDFGRVSTGGLVDYFLSAHVVIAFFQWTWAGPGQVWWSPSLARGPCGVTCPRWPPPPSWAQCRLRSGDSRLGDKEDRNVSDAASWQSSWLLSSVTRSPCISLICFQEAKFEIISSEASYLRSLNVLVSQFANSTKLRHNAQVISSEDWAAVFSNIYQVKIIITILSRNSKVEILSNLAQFWQVISKPPLLFLDPRMFRKIPPESRDMLAAVSDNDLGVNW